jgi:hypothetical protein
MYGFSLVAKCIFVVVTWLLSSRFSASKIFLVLELYFWGVPESVSEWG